MKNEKESYIWGIKKWNYSKIYKENYWNVDEMMDDEVVEEDEVEEENWKVLNK